MSSPFVSASTDGSIRVITLAHPPRNLLNPEVMIALLGELDAANDDASVTGIVLTGDGEAFCGGLDVSKLQAGGDPAEFASRLVAILDRIPKLNKPVVAAVNGDAVASGASIVCACDYAVAVPEAKLGTYEVSIGIWPMVAQVPLIKRLGARAAMENVGSGTPWDAQGALRVGAIQRIVAADELLPAATAWLEQAARAGAAVAAGRPAFYELAELPYDQALQSALDRFVSMFRS